MNKVTHFFMHSRAATYIAALLCVVSWVLYTVGQGGEVVASDSLGLLLCVAVGCLAIKVCREFSFTGMKDTLPTTLFFMGCAIAPQLMPVGIESIHLLLFPLACYILLHTYRDRNAMGRYFFAFILIGLECLQDTSLLFALPWLVLCGAFMESLHMRTFFAALWGFLFPYWVVGSALFLTDNTELITSYLRQIDFSVTAIWPMLATQLGTLLLWTLLLAIPGSVMLLLDRTMKLQVSARFRVLIASLLLLLVTIFLFPIVYPALSPCLLLYASLIGAVFFLRNSMRAKNWYFMLLLVLWILSLAFIHGAIA